MRGGELGQPRQHHVARHRDRHVDPQPAAQRHPFRAEQAAQIVDVLQQVAATLEKHLPVRRQLHPAGGAMQQTGAQVGFQPADGGRHAGFRQAELLGRGREAAQFTHASENLQSGYQVHRSFIRSDQFGSIAAVYIVCSAQ